MCNCPVCTFTRKVCRVKAKLSPRDQAVIDDLLLKWEGAATDAGYWEAHAKGLRLTSLEYRSNSTARPVSSPKLADQHK